MNAEDRDRVAVALLDLTDKRDAKVSIPDLRDAIAAALAGEA